MLLPPLQLIKARAPKLKAPIGVLKSLSRIVYMDDSLAYHAAILLSCEKRSLLTDYTWVKVLGSGSFGRVHLCENRHTGERRAIKLLLPQGGEFSDAFKLDVQETELQQKLASCKFIAPIFSWGTFAGAHGVHL